MQLRYHCEYFLEEEQQQTIHGDIVNLDDKVCTVQGLYQELREQYMQDALDINVFWGNPLWSNDMLKRSSKPIQHFKT
jgi:hypothetical protein